MRASVPLFRELGAPLFDPVGYLFVATSEEGRERLLAAGRAAARARRARRGRGSAPRCAACGRATCSLRSSAARTASQSRQRSRASSSVARPSVGWRCANAPTPASLPHDVLVVAAAPPRRSSCPTCPCGRSAVSSSTSGRWRRLARRSADGGRGGERLPLPPPRRDAPARDARARAALGLRRGRRRRDRRGQAPPPRAPVSSRRRTRP